MRVFFSGCGLLSVAQTVSRRCAGCHCVCVRVLCSCLHACLFSIGFFVFNPAGLCVRLAVTAQHASLYSCACSLSHCCAVSSALTVAVKSHSTHIYPFRKGPQAQSMWLHTSACTLTAPVPLELLTLSVPTRTTSSLCFGGSRECSCAGVFASHVLIVTQ